MAKKKNKTGNRDSGTQTVVMAELKRDSSAALYSLVLPEK